MMRAATTTPPSGVAEGYRREAPPVTREGEVAVLDATGVYYQQLNDAVRDAIAAGATTVRITGMNGQYSHHRCSYRRLSQSALMPWQSL